MLDSYIQHMNEYPPLAAATVLWIISLPLFVLIFIVMHFESMKSKKEQDKNNDKQEQNKSK